MTKLKQSTLKTIKILNNPYKRIIKGIGDSRCLFLNKRVEFMEKLLEILKSIRDDVDFENETKLIDDEILDSFDNLLEPVE